MEKKFIAIRISESPKFLDFANNTRALMRKERMRWIQNKDFHIVLNFLDNINKDTELSIVKDINNIVDTFQSFSINIKSLGKWGTRTLWAGVELNHNIYLLQKKLKDALYPILEKQDNVEETFFPHVVLSQISYLNNKRRFIQIINGNKDYLIDSIQVKNIHLMKSITQCTGTKYITIKSFSLKKSTDILK